MQPVRIRVGDCDCGVERQLAFDAERRLHRIWGAEPGTHLLDRAAGTNAFYRCIARGQPEEIGIPDDILLLDDAVVALSGDGVRETEAIVEHAESGADHCLRRSFPGSGSRRPGDADPRSEITPIVDVGLS